MYAVIFTAKLNNPCANANYPPKISGFIRSTASDVVQTVVPDGSRWIRPLIGLHKGFSVEKAGFQAGLFSEFDRDCLVVVAQDTGQYDLMYEHLSEHYTARALASVG